MDEACRYSERGGGVTGVAGRERNTQGLLPSSGRGWREEGQVGGARAEELPSRVAVGRISQPPSETQK